MPATEVVFYQEDDESVPALEWLERLQVKPRAKCIEKIERLAELGHELTRPEADYLGEGIYELRTRFQSVNYRLLYFFHGRVAAVISHGLTKEQAIPKGDIARAVERKRKFEADPKAHTYVPDDDEGEEE